MKKYEGGRYCTLPHVIELSLVDYKDLFTVLTSEPEIEVLINPFISAWKNDAYEQLEGQIASLAAFLLQLSQIPYMMTFTEPVVKPSGLAI